MSEQPVVAPSVDIEVSIEKQKPRLLALLFCDFTNTTNDDKPNLLGVFDRIFVDPEKRMTPPFVVFVRVAEVSEPFKITMIGPDSVPALQVTSQPIDTAHTEGLPRQVQSFLVLQFEAKMQGVFWFDISYKDKTLGGAGLTIQYRKMEGKQSGTDTYI
jgi:hypothetical protein